MVLDLYMLAAVWFSSVATSISSKSISGIACFLDQIVDGRGFELDILGFAGARYLQTRQSLSI
jgi:hypothetical protein